MDKFYYAFIINFIKYQWVFGERIPPSTRDPRCSNNLKRRKRSTGFRKNEASISRRCF